MVPTRVSQRRSRYPVAVGQSTLRGPFALGQPGEFGHLGFHDRLGEDPDSFPDEVGIAICASLAQQLEHGHSALGRR
jgi:hypothetical protein